MTLGYLKLGYLPTLVLSTLLLGCDSSEQQKLAEHLHGIKANMVYVEGGEFLMGDFGKVHTEDKLYYSSAKDNKPLHTVELTSYSINRFKTTNAEYQFYLAYTKQPEKKYKHAFSKKDMEPLNRLPNTPAHVNWREAAAYCQWLAKVSGLPFALPTEAQWEYAARSRGQFLIMATNDGTFKVRFGKGENVAGREDRKAFGQKNGMDDIFISMLGDSYPPNPLGIYDMAGNGFEWVQDWYDPTYYQTSPRKDPQGPAQGVFTNKDGKYGKVSRGNDFAEGVWGLTIARWPQAENYDNAPLTYTVRCALNSPVAVDKAGEAK